MSLPEPPGLIRPGLLGLGCNLGDRPANLGRAVAALAQAGVQVIASSSLYDTDPVGEVLDQPTFLNACLRIRTTLSPLALLDLVKALERDLGRTAAAMRHGPRTIDIDILLLGDLRVTSPEMTLPHPQLLTRRFVLIPALELDLALRTPDGQLLADALALLPVDEGVRWARPPLEVQGPRSPAGVDPMAVGVPHEGAEIGSERDGDNDL